MRRLIALVALVSGCAVAAPDRVDGQDVAEGIVWLDAYHELDAPPLVYWRPLDAACVDPNTGEPGALKADDAASTCVMGFSHIQDGIAVVGWGGQVDRISRSAYPHELMHFHLAHLYGDPDDNHTRKDAWALVDYLRPILAARGL